MLKDATKQIGLFDTYNNSSINLDPSYNCVRLKKHTILGLKDISTEKSEPTKVEDSTMERFFIKKLYGINHRLIDDISCIFNATDIAIYEIQQGFTPKSPIYKEFTYNIK
ncbi:hypothetical protein PROFUN_16004 [Planoprotostelium fungivorum]|uniref:Uncharacterized protein n=1 Tax=Planoprotostelium fungivorum TaxID=1890364 RepID=A0A2P6MR49_9EUKA|nr:hypothetical protein PROFUN_16004 [Planoprotostelium fungivorum]